MRHLLFLSAESYIFTMILFVCLLACAINSFGRVLKTKGIKAGYAVNAIQVC